LKECFFWDDLPGLLRQAQGDFHRPGLDTGGSIGAVDTVQFGGEQAIPRSDNHFGGICFSSGLVPSEAIGMELTKG
jgi:hypothetical protein